MARVQSYPMLLLALDTTTAAGSVLRQELECADRVHEPVADQREALDGGDADPQAGERAGAGGNGVALDVAGRQAVGAENRHQNARQALGVRWARIAGALLDQAVAPERHAARGGGRIEGQEDH